MLLNNLIFSDSCNFQDDEFVKGAKANHFMVSDETPDETSDETEME